MGSSPHTQKLRPNIFVFHDYRQFLVEWLAYLKSTDKTLSIRKIGKEAGVSAAYLSLVLAQKRSLSESRAVQLAKVLRLSLAEQSFFKWIVILDEAPTQSKRHKAFQKIKRFTQYQESNENQIEAFRYMSEWYYVAIRELAADPDFRGDIKWIQKRLIKHVSSADIEKSLNFLIERKFLIKNETGTYTQPNRNIDCHGGVYQMSLNQFHQQILQLTSEMIDSLPREKRNLTGYTYLMSTESYQEVAHILEDVKNKLRDIEDRDRLKNDEKNVYHVELITIPLTGKS